MPRPLPTLLAVAIMVAALAACGGAERPDVASWLPSWEAVTAVVPDHDSLGDPPDASICQSTLAALRQGTQDLVPTPSVTVDDLVSEWEAVAESAFFDCPPAGEEIGSFEEAYAELSRIEESVTTALGRS